ncbi:copper homeostasis protein CutC [Arenibacter sp. M-2]|uniref:copper homeostasis protein CutC n=1 Tax=unclassified Arenibacter TaxID=2615047 RepID=UPI000D771897|nr:MULTISPECIES: copper homeostasis protein CutC [unclassified Arenibacter]MDL5514032.1 copper homeostasis protein CutC [Arenibacter sp. M-2]PXX25883.1 copper homeostasis protein CutC [Arenibacter sp. ARW7G5Y1]
MIVEVCANSLESALNAQKAGADRIELCAELAVGGVTPSFGLLQLVKEHISIPVNVLIRPRSGDFTYSDLEFGIMKRDIAICRELGFNGIVSGVLSKDFTLDYKRTKELITASRPLQFTFHRAFDWVRDPITTLGQLEELEVDTILSSGQQNSSLTGLDLLIRLLKESKYSTIMPGGGIRDANVMEFREKGFDAVHLSGIQFHRTLDEAPAVKMSTPSFLKDDEIAISNLTTLREVVRLVKEK